MYVICYEAVDCGCFSSDHISSNILQVASAKEAEDTIMELMTESAFQVETFGHMCYGEIKNIKVYETSSVSVEFENFIKENEAVAQLVGQQRAQKQIAIDKDAVKQHQMKEYLRLKEVLGL